MSYTNNNQDKSVDITTIGINPCDQNQELKDNSSSNKPIQDYELHTPTRERDENYLKHHDSIDANTDNNIHILLHRDSKELNDESRHCRDDAVSTNVENLTRTQTRHLKRKKSGKTKDLVIKKLSHQLTTLYKSEVADNPMLATHNMQVVENTDQTKEEHIFKEFTPSPSKLEV